MIECSHLSTGYGKCTVLEDLSVTFEKGKLTGIIGVNGCGKSTLLKTILGILPATSGEILLDGTPLSALSRPQISQKLAYLAQGKGIPDMTVFQMVLHGRFPHLHYPQTYSDHDRELARQALERVGIPHLAEESLTKLSGGMRQTAHIAMALAQNTDYILLDEPTTFLDVGHQLALLTLLRSLAQEGKGILAVMHDLPLAFAYSDEIVLMDGKRVIAKTAPAALASSPLLRETFGVTLRHLTKENRYFIET
ncbi:MAG: ABC transporter ATP-binding protein [Clostridia bacterium]|nr:ABC transporter ATP-binding protein [Clostridia bacterium]